MSSSPKEASPKDLRYQQAKDTGLAAVLVLLLIAHFADIRWLLIPAIVVLVMAMAWPPIFRPLAPLWFGLSHLLGNVVSKIVLTLIFSLVTTPIGLLRRLSGADAMRGKDWKQGGGSVFVNRDYLFCAEDLERPF